MQEQPIINIGIDMILVIRKNSKSANDKFYFQGHKLHFINWQRYKSIMHYTEIESKIILGNNLVLKLKWRT